MGLGLILFGTNLLVIGMAAYMGYRKYKYDGSSFTANSEWVDPSVSILTMDKNRYVQMNTFSDTFIAAVQTEIDRLNG